MQFPEPPLVASENQVHTEGLIEVRERLNVFAAEAKALVTIGGAGPYEAALQRRRELFNICRRPERLRPNPTGSGVPRGGRTSASHSK